MSVPDGIVIPQPALPRTLGILHLIFGTMLILLGTCLLGGTLAGPAFGTYFEQMTQQQTKAVRDRHEAQLKSLDDSIKNASNDEERATYKAERDALAKSPPFSPPKPDMSALESLKNPTIRNAAIAEKLTGIALNIAMIVAGVGLIRVRDWGRILGVRVAVIQLGRAAVFLVIYLVWVVPAQRVETEKMIARLEQQIRDGSAPPTAPATVQMSRATIPFAPVTVVGYYLLAAVYPVVTLVLLQSRGARAACYPSPAKRTLDTLDPS